MTTGEQGRTAPDAEHYLDLSDAREEPSGPHFDVVLRGYDRRQVDEHLAGLQRMVAQLRAQLAVRERRRAADPGETSERGAGSDGSDPDGSDSDTVSEARGLSASRSPAGGPDMVGAFNDRLRGILQAAEQEAQLVRSRAAESLLAEHSESRAALADLRSQRDSVFEELLRARDRLDDLVAHAGRPSMPHYGPGPPRPWGPHGPGQQGPPGRPPRPRPTPSAGSAGEGERTGDDARRSLEADTVGDTDGTRGVDGANGTGPHRS